MFKNDKKLSLGTRFALSNVFQVLKLCYARRDLCKSLSRRKLVQQRFLVFYSSLLCTENEFGLGYKRFGFVRVSSRSTFSNLNYWIKLYLNSNFVNVWLRMEIQAFLKHTINENRLNTFLKCLQPISLATNHPIPHRVLFYFMLFCCFGGIVCVCPNETRPTFLALWF